MYLNLKFKTSEKTEILTRKTKEYFIKQGFKIHLFENNNLVFKRGNKLINKYTFNPLKWKSEIIISFQQKGYVSAIFKVNANDQIVTQIEQEVWNEFINNYKKSIITSTILTDENNENIKKSKKKSMILFFKIIGLTILIVNVIVKIIELFN